MYTLSIQYKVMLPIPMSQLDVLVGIDVIQTTWNMVKNSLGC